MGRPGCLPVLLFLACGAAAARRSAPEEAAMHLDAEQWEPPADHGEAQALAGRAARGGNGSLLQAIAWRASGRGASAGWGATLGLGALCGLLHVLSPDHIGTLITLSAAAAPGRAFAIGASWSCGHCLGMIAVGGVFLLVDHLAGGYVEAWERYGNYAIGTSMIAVALYFALSESSRIEVHADGSSTLKSCECCTPNITGMVGEAAASAAGGAETFGEQPQRSSASSPGSYTRCVPCPPLSGRAPALQPAGPAPSRRGTEGALVGLLQGVCCPSGLLGIAFMAELSAWRVVFFTAAFVSVSVLGTGLLAACWGHLTRLSCGANVSHVALYRASYTFTLVLGIVWIVATFCGLLSKLDFTDAVTHQALQQT